jgi:hypothetical protein
MFGGNTVAVGIDVEAPVVEVWPKGFDGGFSNGFDGMLEEGFAASGVEKGFTGKGEDETEEEVGTEEETIFSGFVLMLLKCLKYSLRPSLQSP